MSYTVDQFNRASVCDLERLKFALDENSNICVRVTGNLNAVQIQGRDVSDAVPNDGDAITWDAGANEWIYSPVSSSVSWGGITGILSDQTDLQSALNGKAPLSHTHTAAQVTDFSAAADARITAQKGFASGIATLDGSGKVPTTQLPALAITSTFVVASQAAQLALSVQEGDVAIRTDLSKSYIQNGGSSGTMADWQELLTPTDTVISVNGFVGAVTLTTSNISNTSGYITSISGLDHNSLGNLPSGDVHTQYALLAGRSGGQTLIGGTASGNTLTLKSTSNATKGNILFGTSAYDEVNNRLGLGKTNPAYQLDLTSSMNIPTTSNSSTGIIFQNGSAIIHTFGNQCMFIGAGVANFTFTGNSNFAMGNTCMRFLSSGSGNVAMGVTAMRDLSSGGGNNAVGQGSLLILGGGSNNDAIGQSALQSNVSGNYNEAIGNNTLGQTTADGNVGIGRQAGLTNVSGNNNIYIGRNADTSVSNLNNSIAIGYLAVVGASNTGVLGSTGTNAILWGTCAGQSTTYAKIGGCIFDHFANAGNTTTTETDLYSDTLPASALAANGQKVRTEYGGVFVSSATATREIKIYFGGTAIFDTGALTLSLSSAWTLYATIVRVSATVVRYMISFATEGAALSAYTAVGELTGLTLSSTNIIKITGQAAGVGAATNDILAQLGSISWEPAA